MRFMLALITATMAIAGEFTTAIGDTYPYMASAIATDAAGNTYVVGSRAIAATGVIYTGIGGVSSTVIYVEPYSGGTDVFLTKLDPNGNVLFTDTFAGKGNDTGTAIAVDPTGNIYIAGTTTSPDFPLSRPLINQPNTDGTGFVMKISNDGSTILYSTYFGGTLGGTSINSLATDSSGNLYLTGTTSAADFPHTSGMPFGPGSIGITGGAILSCISAAGDKILYSGVITGGLIPVSALGVEIGGGVGVAVDAAGNAYFAGNSGTTVLPTTPGVLAPTGSNTGFLAKVNTASGTVSYLTYLPNFASAIAADAAGDIYLAGYIRGNVPPILISLAKINPTASAVVWTNNLGGAQGTLQSIAVDAAGNVWATGIASSSNFPNTNGWTTGPEFLVGLNASGSKTIYSALYPSGTVAQSVAVDPAGLVHVAGINGFISAIAPSTTPTMKIFDLQNSAGGNVTARISPAELITIYGPGIGGANPVGALQPTGGFYPKSAGTVQVTINGANIPLLYVSSNQINAVVPMGLATGGDAILRVTNGTAISPNYPVWVQSSAAQAFPAVVNQNGTINSQSNPARSNSVVTFYGTGWQSNYSPLADGQVATTALNVCQVPSPPPPPGASVGIGLSECQANPPTNVYAPPATVLYGGTAPGIIAGVSQFNLQIGAVAASNFAFQVTYSLIGPSSISQTIWVAY
jgi:uncharacterized protein (TIGR03437 family)